MRGRVAFAGREAQDRRGGVVTVAATAAVLATACGGGAATGGQGGGESAAPASASSGGSAATGGASGAAPQAGGGGSQAGRVNTAVEPPPTKPTPINLGDTVEGSLAQGDVTLPSGAFADDYVATLQAGASVTILARGGESSSSPGGQLEPYVSVIYGTGEIAHDSGSAGEHRSRVIVTVWVPGQYVIRVTSRGDGPQQGRYTLQTMRGAHPDAT